MMKTKITSFVLLLLFFACGKEKQVEKRGSVLHSFVNETPHKVQKIVFPREETHVKNVILMIGDGMGLNVIQSAWTANRGALFLENASHIGLMKTTACDSIITDSASAGTAMATGTKTNRGYLGVDDKGNSLQTICEEAKKYGLSTAVLSTCRIYDATPASFSVENIDRNNAEDIAKSYLDSQIDFVLGGGLDAFEDRADSLKLLPLLREKGYEVVSSVQELKSAKTDKIFGVLAEHDMPIAKERGDVLWQSTKKALEVLSQNEKGFFLMVESAMIDDFGHGNDLPKMMEETLDFDRTLGRVLEWAKNHHETLVIVTADHATGGLTLTEGRLDKGDIKGYFSTGHHDGILVPVYAFGAGAEQFSGIYENTDLCKKMKQLLNLKK